MRPLIALPRGQQRRTVERAFEEGPQSRSLSRCLVHRPGYGACALTAAMETHREQSAAGCRMTT